VFGFLTNAIGGENFEALYTTNSVTSNFMSTTPPEGSWGDWWATQHENFMAGSGVIPAKYANGFW
jgi:hypothetical protein